MSNKMTFRSSRIIYYGPQPCENCGVSIVKLGHDFGGNAFTYPTGPIYPNTEWYPHVCDPKDRRQHRAIAARIAIREHWPRAISVHVINAAGDYWTLCNHLDTLIGAVNEGITGEYSHAEDAWIFAAAYLAEHPEALNDLLRPITGTLLEWDD